MYITIKALNKMEQSPSYAETKHRTQNNNNENETKITMAYNKGVKFQLRRHVNLRYSVTSLVK